jgi:hypothetical protein
MAGVKITDLPALATAASGDLLYIVDISDLSESPEGTSKSIEVGNLAIIESGTWTPTVTTDYDSGTVLTAIYTRVNNSVSFIIKFQLLNTSSIDFGTTTFSPPSGLPSNGTCSGLMAFHTDGDQATPLLLSFTVTADTTNIIFAMTNSVAFFAYSVTIQGTYLIA